MKESTYKNYDDLPLFLNAAMVARVLGVAPSSAYELMHEKDFPTLRVGSRMVVPKEKFIEWVEQHMKGGGNAREGQNHRSVGNVQRTASPYRMSCWTLTCLPVQSPCTSACCVTRTVKQTNATRVKRSSQRSSTSRAIPLPSMFVCWKNVGSSLRSTPPSSRSRASSGTAICSIRSSRYTRSRSDSMSGSSAR